MAGGRIKKTIDGDYLASIEKELRKKIAVAKGMRAAMEASGVEEIEVSGKLMLERGLAQIDTFLLSCKRELGEL